MRRKDIMRAWVARAGIVWLLVLSVSRHADAQRLPSEPIVLGGGLLTVGGNLSATVGPDDPGFFNYTDYEDSTLRMLRLDLTASLRAGSHVSLLGDIRSQNARAPQAYALYLRIRPWTKRRFDLQVGRVPPTFGAFPRRSYEADNPLIGYPLAYQYLTSLRADAVPASADELLQMRGRGWLANYSIGNVAPAPGVPLVTVFRWDTGVQAHAATDFVDLTAAVTTGTLSNPLFRDDNAGRQVAGRIALHPIAGLIVGASAAHGPFVSRQAAQAAVGSDRTAHSRRRRGAATSNTRARTTCCASKRSSASGRCPRLVRRPSADRCARRPPRLRGATRFVPACTSRRAAIIWVSTTSPARRDPKHGRRRCAGVRSAAAIPSNGICC